MKTAISVPDETFELATRRASELGISRSEFFTRAARKYIDELSTGSLTRQIDEALTSTDDDDTWRVAARSGRERLVREADW
ncbi:MAG TPA: hypothetical protein VJT16_25930 [Streptosporangiaceae bacterium]|jgi:hypothetical protein|nr:hypothetical protein [Streptosporangiaceae bacterium]